MDWHIQITPYDERIIFSWRYGRAKEIALRKLNGLEHSGPSQQLVQSLLSHITTQACDAHLFGGALARAAATNAREQASPAHTASAGLLSLWQCQRLAEALHLHERETRDSASLWSSIFGHRVRASAVNTAAPVQALSFADGDTKQLLKQLRAATSANAATPPSIASPSTSDPSSDPHTLGRYVTHHVRQALDTSAEVLQLAWLYARTCVQQRTILRRKGATGSPLDAGLPDIPLDTARTSVDSWGRAVLAVIRYHQSTGVQRILQQMLDASNSAAGTVSFRDYVLNAAMVNAGQPGLARALMCTS